MDKATPILVGIHHLEQREADPTVAREPIQLMIEAVKQAAIDAGSTELLSAGSVRVIKGIWPYQNPAKAVAEAIGCGAPALCAGDNDDVVNAILNIQCALANSGLYEVATKRR